jgi:hypothetical protein
VRLVSRAALLAASLVVCRASYAEAPALAAPMAPTAGVLPSRRADATALTGRLARLARALGPAPTLAPTFSLAQVIGRADAMNGAGRLDEAAALYDVAIEQGSHAPLRVEPSSDLVRALIARAQIGLARGEEARSGELLGRALRWDPTLQLQPGEDAPRMKAALASVRQRLSSRPPLVRDDLGADCEHLLLARRLDERSTQLTRIEQCRPTAQTILADNTPDSLALTALGLAPPPARPAKRPAYQRAWVWLTVVAVGAALAGAGVGIWAATRPTTTDLSWNVTPHL